MNFKIIKILTAVVLVVVFATYLTKKLFLDNLSSIFETPMIANIHSDSFSFGLKKDDNVYLNIKGIKYAKVDLFVNLKTTEEEIECSKFRFRTGNQGGLIRKINLKEIIKNNVCNDKSLKRKKLYFKGVIKISQDNNDEDDTPSIQKNKYFRIILNKLFSIVFKNSSRDLKIKNFQDKKEFIFFFNTKEELLPQQNENLVVIPSSNFYNYFANIFYSDNEIGTDKVLNNYIDRDRDKKHVFLKSSKDLPIYKVKDSLFYPNYDKQLEKSIKNLKLLNINYDLINDFEVNSKTFSNYKRIIFPYHQEYITKKLFNYIISKLENETQDYGTVISFGGADFYRPMNTNKVNGEIESFEFIYDTKNLKRYSMNKHLGGFECEISNRDLVVDKNYSPNQFALTRNNDLSDAFLGEVAFIEDVKEEDILVKAKKIRHFFYDMHCIDELKHPDFNLKDIAEHKNSFKVPMLTIANFKGSKLINFNSDGAGVNFPYHKELLLKFKKEIF